MSTLRTFQTGNDTPITLCRRCVANREPHLSSAMTAGTLRELPVLDEPCYWCGPASDAVYRVTFTRKWDLTGETETRTVHGVAMTSTQAKRMTRDEYSGFGWAVTSISARRLG